MPAEADGRAIKGPLAKMMGELGMPVGTSGILQSYQGFIDALVVDTQDAEEAKADSGVTLFHTDIVMRDEAVEVALARYVSGRAQDLACNMR